MIFKTRARLTDLELQVKANLQLIFDTLEQINVHIGLLNDKVFPLVEYNKRKIISPASPETRHANVTGQLITIRCTCGIEFQAKTLALATRAFRKHVHKT